MKIIHFEGLNLQRQWMVSILHVYHQGGVVPQAVMSWSWQRAYDLAEGGFRSRWRARDLWRDHQRYCHLPRWRRRKAKVGTKFRGCGLVCAPVSRVDVE